MVKTASVQTCNHIFLLLCSDAVVTYTLVIISCFFVELTPQWEILVELN